MRPNMSFSILGSVLRRIRYLDLASKFHGRREAGAKATGRWGLPLAGLGLVLLFSPLPASTQDRSIEKLPVIDKIASAAEHQAFSGTVQSLDEKHNILNVNSVEGGATEIFPVKKTTPVYTTDGYRRKPSNLTPGTNVIVYFELHADHRTVKRIEILAGESKKQAPPS